MSQLYITALALLSFLEYIMLIPSYKVACLLAPEMHYQRQESSATNHHPKNHGKKHTEEKKKFSKIPHMTIHLKSIRNMTNSNPKAYNGWGLQIVYKFDRGREKGKVYGLAYSSADKLDYGQAFLINSKNMLDDLAPSSHALLPERIPLNTDSGTITAFLPQNGHPKLKSGVKIQLVIEIANEPEKGFYPPPGYNGSNILCLAHLP